MRMTTRGATAVGLLLAVLLVTGCEELEQKAPPKASNPHPNHNATNVSRDASLNWDEVSAATDYRVYFGTDASPDSGEFQGEQSRVLFRSGAVGSQHDLLLAGGHQERRRNYDRECLEVHNGFRYADAEGKTDQPHTAEHAARRRLHQYGPRMD